jgi:hypothetical protein
MIVQTQLMQNQRDITARLMFGAGAFAELRYRTRFFWVIARACAEPATPGAAYAVCRSGQGEGKEQQAAPQVHFIAICDIFG